LDGVLTPTAKVHAMAWKSMFDAYVEHRDRTAGAQGGSASSSVSIVSVTRKSSTGMERTSS
jgi:beta-phosphoglucomutase-like phosphatase (HAD superfamily)